MIEGKPGEKYRPSNGSESEFFMARFCDKCAAFNICNILMRTMGYDIDDPKYPKQWTFDESGQATCTSFRDKATVKRGKNKFIPDGETEDMFK